jgi:diguanylate cyclase (GGDEF)-like protein
VTNANGRVVQYIGVQNDVSDRVQAQRDVIRERDRGAVYLARIEQLAYTDSLTGLMNRRRFEDRFEAALLSARMQERAVALLFMDLDGFKSVNDAHGHAAGDELLRTVARRLRDRVRKSDLLARLGGDEFLVGLTGLDPANARLEAQAVAEQLRSSVSAPVPLSSGEVRIDASIGVSVRPDDAEDFGPLFHVADLRMSDLEHPAASPR